MQGPGKNRDKAQGSVLVVDDDPTMRGFVRACLERNGFDVRQAATGQEGLEAAQGGGADLIVLDVLLPDIDGLTVCRELRRHSEVPIIMISTHGEDVDKVLGLEVGADDYLAKPFSPMELVARVRAILRRARGSSLQPRQPMLTDGSVVLDVGARRVTVEGVEVALTPLEFALLHQLMANQGQVLTRPELLARCWGPDHFGVERTVDVHLRNVRLKLQSVVPTRQFIRCVRQVGFRYEP